MKEEKLKKEVSPCIEVRDCNKFLPGDIVKKHPASKDKSLSYNKLYTVEKCVTVSAIIPDLPPVPSRDMVFLKEINTWCFWANDLLLVPKNFSKEWNELEKI